MQARLHEWITLSQANEGVDTRGRTGSVRRLELSFLLVLAGPEQEQDLSGHKGLDFAKPG
jgi:hypothetical protein